jgi:quinol monooxygenase YgiN
MKAALTGAVLVFLTSFLFVSCSDGGGGGNHNNAQKPIISVQPQGNIWDVEFEDEFELTVEASVTDGGTLSYQWYSNTTKSKSGGTVIYQENSETLTLNSDDYNTENGDYYFYVIVTNTKAGGKASVTSDVAVVTVDGVGGVYLNAQKPIIDTQPADTFWNVFTTASGVKLTVEAGVTDGGTLSYQWYSNTSANAVNGTKIDTATDKDYTLTKTAYTANGTYYLYVIITNTNDDVTGMKDVHETSNVVTVTVVGYPDTGYSDTHTMPSKLTGEWESEYGEIYTISAGEFSSGGDWGEGWSGYKGTIVNHRGNAEGTAGYITIQYTQNDWDETAENKYYVIYYKDLTETTVTIAGAGSFTFTDPDFGASGGRETKEEAEATYTVSAGYFAMGSDLVKAEEVVNAATPTITTHPVGGIWKVYNNNTNSMTVMASVTDGGNVTYEWFRNTSNSTTGATKIGTGGTLTLSKADYLITTTYYFYAVATNTKGTHTSTKTSNIVEVKVNPLDENLIGKWNYSEMEQITITANNTYLYESIDWLNDDDDYDFTLVPFWGGKIVYTENFDAASGVIIIEYLEGQKQVWIDWNTSSPRDPQPEGNFYGIYFSDLTTTTSPWTAKVFNTSDQNNGYGPTETVTLQEAINRFTKDSIDDWLASGVGDALSKVE